MKAHHQSSQVSRHIGVLSTLLRLSLSSIRHVLCRVYPPDRPVGIASSGYASWQERSARRLAHPRLHRAAESVCVCRRRCARGRIQYSVWAGCAKRPAQWSRAWWPPAGDDWRRAGGGGRGHGRDGREQQTWGISLSTRCGRKQRRVLSVVLTGPVAPSARTDAPNGQHSRGTACTIAIGSGAGAACGRASSPR